VVPAIAVADALRDRAAEVSFLGTRERAEAQLVPAAGYEIDFLRVRGLDRRNPLRASGAVARAAAAVPAARRLLRERGAEVVMGGGGYVAGPAGLAALRAGLPLVLTEADSHLGLANRLLARRARRVCLAFPIAGREEPRYLVTGRPVPRAVLDADREAARRRFEIAPEASCLLVFGGSQGARSINLAAVEAFATSAVPEGSSGGEERRGFHVLHVAGRRDYPELRSALDAGPLSDYTLIEYEPDLGEVLAASDLVLARSGGSVFEIAAAGRPALLVPYPYATGDHQSHNAAWMADAGAALILTDEELTAERLRAEVGGLLGDPGRLAAMATASRAIAKPDAAERIADEILAAAEAGSTAVVEAGR
jgi:UDP-N-acetylglucosamine--N-acetylmuramyl-(pentapeptide) pyrophosphoryl-undecaprenol N-acetylglucosamine transferase